MKLLKRIIAILLILLLILLPIQEPSYHFQFRLT